MSGWKRRGRILGELYRIQTINYFTDPVNIVLGFVLTTITMVCWIAFKGKSGDFSTDPFILASAVGISVIRNSQYNLNLTICDWREKHFFSKLAQTPISRELLVFAVLSFNWFINIFVALILFGFAMCFSSQRIILHQVQWLPFWIGFILNVFLSNIMALFLNTIFKKKDVVLVVSLLSYFGPMYLLGLGIPWNVVGNYKGLNIFMYLAPHRYVLSIMQAGWIGRANDMSYPLLPEIGGVKPDSWLGTQGFGYGGNGWWLPAVVSIGWCLLFGIITVVIIEKRYNFGPRKYHEYSGVQVHLRYINQIKRTKSVEELNTLINYINANSNYDIKIKNNDQEKGNLIQNNITGKVSKKDKSKKKQKEDKKNV